MKLRNQISASVWIDEHKPHEANPINYVLNMPAIRQAKEEQGQREQLKLEQQRQRAIENRKTGLLAKKWEKEHAMPPVGAVSSAQESFARRCRYLLCLSNPTKARQQLDAGYWIARYLEQHATITSHQ